MAVSRVLVLFRNQLFGQAVRAILEQAVGIQLVGVRPCNRAAVESIGSLKPDVVIVERDRTSPDEGCSAELAEFVLAGEVSGVREIFLSLESGKAWVCDSWYLQDIGRDELLEVVLDPLNSTGKRAAIPRRQEERRGIEGE